MVFVVFFVCYTRYCIHHIMICYMYLNMCLVDYASILVSVLYQLFASVHFSLALCEAAMDAVYWVVWFCLHPIVLGCKVHLCRV